jgi:hypothetical protein
MVKYGVAALCWALVLMWLLLLGRGGAGAR